MHGRINLQSHTSVQRGGKDATSVATDNEDGPRAISHRPDSATNNENTALSSHWLKRIQILSIANYPRHSALTGSGVAASERKTPLPVSGKLMAPIAYSPQVPTTSPLELPCQVGTGIYRCQASGVLAGQHMHTRRSCTHGDSRYIVPHVYRALIASGVERTNSTPLRLTSNVLEGSAGLPDGWPCWNAIIRKSGRVRASDMLRRFSAILSVHRRYSH